MTGRWILAVVVASLLPGLTADAQTGSGPAGGAARPSSRAAAAAAQASTARKGRPSGRPVRPAAAEDVNRRNADGSTPLQWAVYDGNLAEVKRLLHAGATVATANKYGATAMSLAAEVGDPEMIGLLLEAGADADSPNPDGQTALMAVARTGNVTAAERLLAAGATVDARERFGGQTALMWASARRHPEMMRLLIARGADVNARSTVRDYQRHVTAEGRPKNLDSGGFTPLLYAARENCLACADVLIASGDQRFVKLARFHLEGRSFAVADETVAVALASDSFSDSA